MAVLRARDLIFCACESDRTRRCTTNDRRERFLCFRRSCDRRVGEAVPVRSVFQPEARGEGRLP